MQPGRVLGKAYRVERALGAGGVGAVYEAVQVRTGRRYAVKLLLPEIAMREGAAARFRREAEALAAIGHSGIVQIHDFDTDEDGTQFLVMDLLEGEDLATRIAREGALDLPAALRIFEEIGTALSAAHALGIVHRDLKPANVFLARRPGAPERATILDFGLAKNLAGPSAHLTATGVGLGTPLYMSPEQARGEDVDLRTDVYALGCILFEMLTGSAPFTGPTISVVIAKILAEEPPLVSAHARRPTPPALDEVVRMALAKRSTDRYATVRALVDAAHRAAGDSSDRALAATALPSSPSSPSLPTTRDALTVERVAVSSIRPPASTTDPSARAAPSSIRPAAHGAPAWAWVTIGVLTTLLVVMGVAVAIRFAGGAGAQEAAAPMPPPTTSAAPPPTTSVAPLPTSSTPLETAPIEVARAEVVTPTSRELDSEGEGAAQPRRRPPATVEARDEVPAVLPTTPPASLPPATAPPVTSAAIVPPVPPTGFEAQRRQEAQATLRAYDAQIAGYRSHLRDLEAFLPTVIELRRQASSLAPGREPAVCQDATRARLTSASRSDESLVASVASNLAVAIDPLCTGYQRWRSPGPEDREAFASVGREIDHAEDMLERPPADAPPDEVETARHALASMRRLHEAQPTSYASYPCHDAAVDELAQATRLRNGWCAEATSRVARRVERACSDVSMSDRRFSQLTRTLGDRTDGAEQQLREGIERYRDLVERLEGASRYVAGVAQ
ncbi:MAG: protein kinase [Sandaracinaceae bacterium]|nr:protein kinase [Sandaracinaceae bacterium]